jgi:hypothetical protein
MKEIDEKIEANTFLPESSVAEPCFKREWTEGVRIDELKELDTLVVETAHHTYELTIVNPAIAEVLIRGGTFFSKRTLARVVGASMGGSSSLKIRGIYVGLKVELQIGNTRIITSRVRKISMFIGSQSAIAVREVRNENLNPS